jgi:predicted nucleic acid-binding protein
VTLVLDASVAMRWLADDGSAEDKTYAKLILRRIISEDVQAFVPAHWSLEVAHVLARGERRGSITADMAELFLTTLGAINIYTDHDTSVLALTSILDLSRLYNLSSYDAAYLELAMRLECPLATLDKDLRRAAERAGVEVV